ncbi:response regulator transcription factor [Orrella sp. JC864]|uniref:response regulator transcription factor n=1 Tax=Orrella sp. JC864 TaxID=3120298 RepID=UPI0030086198
MLDVILLEDEPVLRQELGEFLEELGYAPVCLSSLEEFERRFEPGRHRLAIIDIGLPDGCGLELIRRLRTAGEPVGIIVFSARGTSADKVLGLELGADHYLGKNADLDVLAATLAALVRSLALVPAAPAEESSCWVLDMGPRVLHIPGAPTVPLSQQDALVLRCLMARPGQNVTRRQVVEALGAQYLDYDQRRLDTQMLRLRRRIGSLSGRTLPVKTVRNTGYCFYAHAEIRA